MQVFVFELIKTNKNVPKMSKILILQFSIF